MKLRILLSSSIAIIAAIAMSSCTTYIANYNIGLQQVEKPANAKYQFGETQIMELKDGEITKYQCKDNFIDIIWYVDIDNASFCFALTNKSDYSLKINWDDCSYVDIYGKAHKLMHSGVKFTDRNSSQAPTTIPKEAMLEDTLVPTDNISFNDGKWDIQGNIFPRKYKSTYELGLNYRKYEDKKIRILLPIIIENVQNDYTFTFEIGKFEGLTRD